MKRHAHNYAELAKVGHKYYGDTNFCTVIAVAVAAQVSFGKANAAMKKVGRRHGKGTHYPQYIAACEALGCTVEEIAPKGKTICTAARACRAGVYWIQTNRHVTAVQDGIIQDWAQPSNRKRVNQMWKITRNFKELT